MDKISTLKVDKDCHVEKSLEEEWTQQTIAILLRHHVRVRWIKATRTRKGPHYYIRIDPSVDADTANRLQYLLGDDAKRVALNQARINSRLNDWNLLFEKSDARRRLLYIAAL